MDTPFLASKCNQTIPKSHSCLVAPTSKMPAQPTPYPEDLEGLMRSDSGSCRCVKYGRGANGLVSGKADFDMQLTKLRSNAGACARGLELSA